MRIAFTTTRGAGHFGPIAPFAHACVRAGHDVVVVGPASAGPMVDRAGLRMHAVGEPPARAAAWAPVFSRDAPDAMHVIQELFVGLDARAALPRMLAFVEDWRPDLIVRESCEFASCVAAERFGIPLAQIGIHLSTLTDTAEPLRQIAAPALDELGPHALAEPVPVLTSVPPSLDGPDAPPVHRYRTSEQRARRPEQPPLVYVSFGSEAPQSPHFPRLYSETAHALAGLPVRVLMTIGDRRDPAELGVLPANVRVERWVSQAAVMPHAVAMVGHGGSGGTLTALAAGVPVALIPLFVDGPANARRVAEIGAGLMLESASGLGEAVAALLDDPRYREAAGRVADEVRALPPVDEAVELLVSRSVESAAR